MEKMKHLSKDYKLSYQLHLLMIFYVVIDEINLKYSFILITIVTWVVSVTFRQKNDLLDKNIKLFLLSLAHLYHLQVMLETLGQIFHNLSR
jgi:hypothetical protein